MAENDSAALFDPSLWSRPLRLTVFGVALFVAVWAGAAITVEESLLTLWPAAGIYVAVLLLHPYREWPLYVLAALPSAAAFVIVREVPAVFALLLYVCGTIQALLGATLVRRFVVDRPSLGTPREVIGFFGLAGLAGTGAGSAVAAWFVMQRLPEISLAESFYGPWMASALGVVILGPMPLRAVRGHFRFPRSVARAAEAGAIGILATIATWVAVTGEGPFSLARIYLVIPLLVWAAIRFGVPGAAMAHFLAASTAVVGLHALAPGLAARGALGPEHIFSFQAFLGVGAAAFLVLAAALEERESTNRALTEVNQWMEHLVTSSPIPVVATDIQGNVVVWNDAAEDMFGWTAEEVLGDRFAYVPAEETARYRSARDRVEAGERLTRFPGKMMAKNGEIISVLVSAAPVYATDSDLWGLISVYEEAEPEEGDTPVD